MNDRNYPIEQSDIEAAIERLKIREQNKGKQIIRERRRSGLSILPLSEAIRRLGDDEVFRKASKGTPFDKND